jgi:hypothetical protein
MAGKTYRTTEPDVIRRWAAVRDGKPAVMLGSADVAQQVLPCIVFSDYNYAEAYTAVSWRELFERMHKDNLVFLYQEKTESGDLSRLGRFVSSEKAAEADAEPDSRQENPFEETALYQTEDLHTPEAQGTRMGRHPERTARRSRRLLIGFALLAVLILCLIIGVFWPRT